MGVPKSFDLVDRLCFIKKEGGNHVADWMEAKENAYALQQQASERTVVLMLVAV